jgi:hypothetical protein
VIVKLTGLVGGVWFGFVLAWARLSDPRVIRQMLLLREAHVFLVMGAAIAVAAVGLRILRAVRAHAVVTGEPIRWSHHPPPRRYIVGSLIFGAGWSIAGTCPGPVAAMVGEGRLGGLFVIAGLLVGAALQPALVRPGVHERQPASSAEM